MKFLSNSYELSQNEANSLVANKHDPGIKFCATEAGYEVASPLPSFLRTRNGKKPHFIPNSKEEDARYKL